MRYPKNQILNLFKESLEIINNSQILENEILNSISEITKCLKKGNKIVLFGNGGSAADAQHMAAEFIGKYLLERKSLPAIALTTDTSILTAIGNDYSFDKVFSRQCESIVQKGDIVIAISTSGNSINVIEGVITAKKKGAYIIGLTGNNGGNLKKFLDINLVVPSKSTPRIQEVHRILMHIICENVENNLKHL